MFSRLLRSLVPLSALIYLPMLAHAQGTRLWSESTYGDWEKGTPKGVAIGSDGTLSPGFNIETVAQFTAADVWAVASDGSGDAYVATGSPAQVVRVAADGKQSVIFTSKDLSVQSLAVGPDGALYAATLPSAKVYRIALGGTKPLDDSSAPVVFSAVDTEAKPRYIWAMAFDAKGRMYLGSGAPGAVYRVSLSASAAAAKPELFFPSDEPHIRSLLFAPNGDLLAGSDGSGLVYRIAPNGKGLVAYEAGKREITALALGTHGQLYIAAVGEKGRNTGLPQLPAGGAPAGTASITVTVVQPGSTQAVSSNAAIPDGSEVDLLPAAPAEAPHRLWAAHEDVLYGLRVTPDGVLAATGNRGRLYRLHDDGTFQDVGHADAGQAIGFADAQGGAVYVATANTGKLLRMSLAPVGNGTLQSEVFDATQPSLWGRADVTAGPGPANFRLEARTGNIDNPLRGWSDWKPVQPTDPTLGQPPARFAQWRLTLGPGARVSQLGVYYLPANAAPEVDEVMVAPGTRVNAAAVQPSYPAQTTLNFASQGGAAINIDANSPQAALSAFRDKNSISARWAAHDDNGDELRFSLYFRGAQESEWRLLKNDLSDRYYSFDATLLPDGPYRLRVVATDAPSHPRGDALTGERTSDLFLVDTSTPQVASLAASVAGGSVRVTATVTDAMTPIARAEYSLDAGPWQYVDPVGRLSDSLREQYSFDVPLPAASPSGAHILTLRAFDRFDNVGSAKVSVH